MLAELRQLIIQKDERGQLTEIYRHSQDPFGFGQAYITTCKRGAIKAWHCHQQQYDRWFCVKGSAVVGIALGDAIQTIYLSDRKPQLLIIPAGIWHGFAPTADCSEATILNLPSTEYYHVNPDEQRLPLDAFALDWEAATASQLHCPLAKM